MNKLNERYLPDIKFGRMDNCITAQKGDGAPYIIFEILEDGSLRRCWRVPVELGFKRDYEGKVVVSK